LPDERQCPNRDYARLMEVQDLLHAKEYLSLEDLDVDLD
jgi:hypothetical protein